MAAWICVILQGALRKWVFPGLQIMYLVQDVPLLFAYMYAFYARLFRLNWLAWSCIVCALILSMQTLMQIIVVGLPVQTAVIGLHHYLFYLPILFMAPLCFNAKHRLRFLRFNLLSTIPMALIATIQSRSSNSAWINRTSLGDNTAFSISGSDAFRSTGTFNFTLPYSIWCGIVAALVIGEWLQPEEQRSFKSTPLLMVCSISALLATAVSGSRTAVFLTAAAFAGGFVSVVITQNRKYIIRFVAVTILLPIIAGLGFLVSPDSFTGNVNRFEGEDASREMTTRVEGMTFGFLTDVPLSLLGEGIGKGIQASNVGSNDAYEVDLSEWDPIRGVQELGSVTGTALVLFRYGGSFALFFAGVAALKQRPSSSYSLPLAATAIPQLALGDIWRVAPQIATQVFFCIAFIIGTMLFRREVMNSETQQQLRTR
jgi:hypothetical protein